MMLKLGDLFIDVGAARSFIGRWSSLELSLGEFTKMLEESVEWHNIPISVLKTVAHFESGWPASTAVLRRGGPRENPYRSNFKRPGSVFVGPFQEGDVYLAGVKENKAHALYRTIALPSTIDRASLGLQLYLMIAEKVRLAGMQWRGVGSIAHAPANAGTIYSLHVRPLAAFKWYAKRTDFDVKLPTNIYSGQSAAVTKYFSASNVSSLQPMRVASETAFF